MNINHRHYILLIFATLAILGSATGYILMYRESVIQARGSALAQAEVILENNKKLHEQELTAAYADSLSDRSRLSSFLVSEDEIVEFIESVEAIGASSGAEVEISGIDTEEIAVKDEESFGHISAHLNISGTWVNVMRALILVENMPYSVSLNNIGLFSSGTAKAKQWELSLDMRVLTSK